VFGDEGQAASGNSGNDTPSGTCKFFTANLLVRPLRVSQGDWNKSYVLATTKEILVNLETLTEGLDKSLALKIPVDITGKVNAEGKDRGFFAPANPDLFGEAQIALVKCFEDFELPIVARNRLNDKGISESLWYEEFVPYTSRFYFFVLAPEGDTGFEALKKLLKDGAVQFGGNASVGYGYCNVKEVELP